MTPEKRAIGLMKMLTGDSCSHDGKESRLASAFREAIDDEREACAKECDAMFVTWDAIGARSRFGSRQNEMDCMKAGMALSLAHNIRARKA